MSSRNSILVPFLIAACLLVFAGTALADGLTDAITGETARKAGRLDEAVDLLSRAIQSGELDQDNLAKTYLNRGTALWKKDDLDGALRDYTEAIRLKPAYTAAFYNRGLLYERRGQYDMALADLTRTLELEPQNWMAYHNRSLVWFRMGDYQRSVADCTHALEIAPKEPSIYGNRALAYDKLGMIQEGLADAVKQYDLNPTPEAQALVDYFMKKGQSK